MKLQLPGQKTRYWQVFWLCLLVAAVLFLPHCIADAAAGGGYFHYAGDFNDQQINFYQYANSFVKQGGTFSWATDLGSGFVNSYSFYLLGSPFFWLSLLVPARFMPWMMVPLLCLKIALAGGGAYLWARRWVRDEEWSMVAGCLYAFSGFTVYNIFFNHFIDVVALFPYMLASLDDAVLDGKKGHFPFWVAVNLLNNYFFFAGQAVFLVIYFFCMLAGRAYKIGPRKFAVLAGETVLGCALGCVLLLPAGLSLLQNPRTIDPFNGMGYLVYGKAQQYGAIFYSAFLMPDAPYFKDMFSEGILKHTSLTAYLPVVGIAGGLAFCRGRRSHPFTYILKVCIVCAFVPVLNSLFYALNSSYYARWYYMPVLVLCGATASLLARTNLARRELPRAWGLTLAVTLSAAAFGLVPYTDDDGVTTLGVTDEPARFWAILGVTVLGLLLFGVLWHFFRDRQRWPTVLLAAVLAFSFVYGSVHLSLTKYAQWDTDSDLIAQTYDSVEEVRAALPDDTFYRIDAYGAHNNLGLWFDKSCLQFFNSTVAPSIMEFYPEVGVKRDVNSKPEVKNYALRGLLSVEYLITTPEKRESFEDEADAGWTYLADVDSYALYHNDNYVPMGFTYDYYVTKQTYEASVKTLRSNLLMRALVLEDGDVAQYGQYLTELPDAMLDDLHYDSYTQDCADRRAHSCSVFQMNNAGFHAEITLDKANLVFFSVPYDDGFTAYVNGEKADILQVDEGLMAVLCPAGASSIDFVYQAAGLSASRVVTAVAIPVWVVYVACFVRRKRRSTGTPAEE